MRYLTTLSCLLVVGCATSTQPPKIAATTNKSPETAAQTSGVLTNPLTPAQEALKEEVRQQVIRAAAVYHSAHQSVPAFPSIMVLPHQIEVPVELGWIVSSGNDEIECYCYDFYLLGEMDNRKQEEVANLAHLLMANARITVEPDLPSTPGWIWIKRELSHHPAPKP
jgi:hypothetical protein